MTLRAKAKSAPGGALCQCGRPLGHTGRHKGGPFRRSASAPAAAARRPKIVAAVEAEISRSLEQIARLKGEIASRQADLQRAEQLLRALRPVQDIYQGKALPAPEAAATAVPESSVTTPSGKPFRIGAGTAVERRHVA